MTRRKKNVVQDSDYLSTGSTLLNLAYTGHPQRGYCRGLMHHKVGDSSAGKTVLALTAFAEASVNPGFKDFRFEFTNQEGGARMDWVRYYGPRMVERVNKWRADSLQDFYARILRIKPPFLCVVDSLDALVPEEEWQHEEAEAKARDKGKKASGSYGTGKSKVNSSRLRMLSDLCLKTGSIVILISQTRQNIGWNSQYVPKTYSGGNSILFYVRTQAWMSIREELKVKDDHVGVLAKVRVSKSHLTGWHGKVMLPIIRNHGVDDTGACVDYLVDEGVWKEKAGVISAPEFAVSLDRETLAKYLEANDMVDELRQLVVTRWEERENATRNLRRPRYD